MMLSLFLRHPFVRSWDYMTYFTKFFNEKNVNYRFCEILNKCGFGLR